MKTFNIEDIPYIIDATFAIALHAYALVLKDHVDETFKIDDVLLERFLNQGLDPAKSKEMSIVINNTIVKLIKDAQEQLK
jgi:hypothetical protein